MIIGIAGGSGSGKSSLAHMLSKRLSAKTISLDDYFKDPSTFPAIYGHYDYDRLESIDFEKCITAIKSTSGTIIVEGFLILASPELRELLDISFFIDTDPETLSKRRIVRDPEINPDYITKHVQARYRVLVLPTKVYADKVLDGKLPNIATYETAWEYLKSRGFVPAAE